MFEGRNEQGDNQIGNRVFRSESRLLHTHGAASRGRPSFVASNRRQVIGQLFTAQRLRTLRAVAENRDWAAGLGIIQMNTYHRDRSLRGIGRLREAISSVSGLRHLLDWLTAES